MLTVTAAASARLEQILKRESLPDEIAIRFVHEGQGLAMQPDSERPGDVTFRHGGRIVLLLDSQVAELLAEDMLDVEDDQLTLRHPQADE